MKKLVVILPMGLLLVTFSCDDSANDESALEESEISIADYTRINAVISGLEDLGFSEVESEGLSGDNSGGRTSFTRDCVEFTFDRQEDGTVSYTYIYDFGDGCEIDEIMLDGRVTVSLYLNEEMTFEQRVLYEDLTMDEWAVDGEEITIGTYSFGMGEGVDLALDYTIEQNLAITACDGSDYGIMSGMAFSITNESKTVTSLEQTIETNDLTYVTTLEIPLVQDFICGRREVYTYTQGVIKTTAGTSEFLLDYGDGACDNLVFVTENDDTTEKEASELVQDDLCN